MEDDAADLVDKIKEELGSFNVGIANAVYDYYTLNEFNSIFMFQSELNDKEECLLLDVLASQFNLPQYQIDWIYNTIYETVFGYKPQQITEEMDDDIQENEYKHDDTLIISPSELDWNLTHYEKSKYITFISKHFPRLSQNLCYGPGKSLIHILAVGYKHKIDLLSLLFDIFMEHRISTFINSNKRKYIQWKDYIEYPYFTAELNNNIYKHYRNAMEHYIRKFQHVLMLNPLNEINDSYYSFVQYTFALTQAMNKLQNVFINGSGCPLQIDFWIIPNHVISISDTSMIGFGPEFDYIEDDEEENVGFLDELNAPNTDDNDPQIGKIEQRLDSAQIEYIKEILNHNEHKNNISTKILNSIKFIAKNEYQFKRIIIIIDRRHSSSKLNKNSDCMYVFQPNKPYGQIIRNRFCHETLHNLSISFMLPKLIYEERVNHIGCNEDLKGRMFTLSFHIYGWNKIRCYWYLQHGTCTRFKPKYLYQLWPHYFFNDINRSGFKKINKDVVEKEFKIPINDKLFDVWYPLVTKQQF